MAGKRTSKRKSEIEKPISYDWDKSEDDEELGIETSDSPIYNKVRLQSRISARIIASGSVSGKRYEWKRSGAIVEVDEEDAPGLLEKRLGDKTCCGGSPDNLKVFIRLE